MDLESQEREPVEPKSPRGALALIGAWGDLEDAEIDALIAAIYAQRERDVVRPVKLEE